MNELKRLITTHAKHRIDNEKTRLASGEPCAARFHDIGSTREHDAGPHSCSCSKFTPPHAGTVSWLCGDPRLKSWVTERDSNKLWIRGKPGSGKSTLTKFLVQKLEKRFWDERSTIIIHYFFDGSQHHLDHASTRLLVSLLQQVSAKHINTHPPGLPQEAQIPKLDWPDGFRTCREYLRQHLSRKLQSRSKVFLVVDGLDECSGDEIADVIDLCKSLEEDDRSCSMKLLFSSRRWPVPFGQEHETVDLDFENRQWASTFIHQELAFFMSIKNRQEDTLFLLDEIQRKAEYNFLWSSLILLLLNLMSEGDAKPSDQLTTFPSTLEGTYKILAQELSARYDNLLQSIPNAAQILSWLALAVRPMSLLELETALSWMRRTTLLETMAESTPTIQSSNIATPLGIAKRLSESTGGMIRIVYTHRGAEIRLLHESVRDFLLQPRMKELHLPLADISKGRSVVHLEMARTCMRYTLSNVSRVQPTEEFPSTILARFPFLEYATSSWTAHAKAANSGSISDEEFLRYFPWPTDPEMRLVGLASSIVRLSFGASQETSFTFLHYAAYRGLDKPLRAFVRLNQKDAKLPDIDMPTIFGRTPLHIAASMGHWSVTNYLLARGAEIKAKDSVYGNSVLHWIALSPSTEGKAKTLEHLVKAGVEIDECSNGMTPLSLAAAYGDARVISTLLNAGADPNGMDRRRGLTALSLAIVHKHVVAAYQLLDAGACLDYGDIRTGLTPLEMAIATRQQEVVSRLLRMGAKVSFSQRRLASQDQEPDHQDERMWLDRMLILFRDFVSSGFVECPSQSCNSQGSHSNQSNQKTQRSSSCSRRKRTTGDDDDKHGEEDDNDEEHSKRRKLSEHPPNDEVEDYCCPYYARNPRKFHSCRKRRWKRGQLHHILEHLKDHHYISLCGRCKVKFPDDEQLEDHGRQRESCPFNETRNYDDGYDMQQHRRLHDRKRGSEKKLGPDGFWNRICHILFEDQHEANEVPNISRALDTDRDLQEFENFMRQRIRDSSSLRQRLRETIRDADEGMLDRILRCVCEMPGSLSERWRRQREDESMTPSSGMNMPLSRETEKTSAGHAVHMGATRERESGQASRVPQPNLNATAYDFRQSPLTSSEMTNGRVPAFLTNPGSLAPPPPPPPPPQWPPPPLPPPPHGPTYPGIGQNLQQFQFCYYPQMPQQPSLAVPVQFWQAQPPYNALPQHLGFSNMLNSDPFAGYSPMVGAFSSPNQRSNPLPIEGYAPNPAAGQSIGGNQLGDFDTWGAIRNQQTSTRSSYAHSNTVSHLGRAHTSATSQSQPETFETSDPNALLSDLAIDGLFEPGRFPLANLNLPTSVGLGENDDQEDEEGCPSQC